MNEMSSETEASIRRMIMYIRARTDCSEQEARDALVKVVELSLGPQQSSLQCMDVFLDGLRNRMSLEEALQDVERFAASS